MQRRRTAGPQHDEPVRSIAAQEYNICFTTVVRPKVRLHACMPGCASPAGQLPRGPGLPLYPVRSVRCGPCRLLTTAISVLVIPPACLQDGGMAALPEPSEEMAHLPRVIRTLVQRRRTVKDLIKREADPVGGCSCV